MLTFSQFLTEKFLNGVKSSFGYAEVYKNPTHNELTELAGSSGDEFELGAIVSGSDLYVWDRESAEHKDVKHLVPNLKSDWLPLYLYYNPDSKKVAVDVSGFTMSATGRNSGTYSRNDIVKSLQTHPRFKMFSKVTLF